MPKGKYCVYLRMAYRLAIVTPPPPPPGIIGTFRSLRFTVGVAAKIMHSYWNIPIC